MEKTYFLKPNRKLILKIYFAVIAVIFIIFLIPSFIYLNFYFLLIPLLLFVISIIFISIALVFMGIPKSYIKLTDNALMIKVGENLVPYNIKYSDLKSISISNNTIKKVIIKSFPMPIVLYSKMEDSGDFIKTISNIYKKKTGKNLVVEN